VGAGGEIGIFLGREDWTVGGMGAQELSRAEELNRRTEALIEHQAKIGRRDWQDRVCA